MVDCAKNLYEILGVSFNASFSEIKFAYKKLARIYHPDINKSTDAEIKFKLLNSAYATLSDVNKKKEYDNLLSLSKKLSKKEEKKTKEEILPEYNKDVDLVREIKITEEEANVGAFRTVNILNTQKCPKCLGKKFLNGIKCAFCLGEGEKKEFKKIDVEIKKGTKNGEYLYVGKINSSALYDKNLFLKILVEPEKEVFFEGNKIITNVEVPLYDAILGTETEINIKPFGLVKVEVPPLSSPNTRIKIDVGNERVECYATIDVIFPKNISFEEKRLYDKIRLINLNEQNENAY